jgi:hypothetical protein
MTTVIPMNPEHDDSCDLCCALDDFHAEFLVAASLTPAEHHEIQTIYKTVYKAISPIPISRKQWICLLGMCFLIYFDPDGDESPR